MPPPRALRPCILLVEDDEAARSGYAELLQSQGFEVVQVDTAEAARAAVANRAPDLALIDVLLPDGDGLDLAMELRGNAVTADMPVIAFTGHWSAEHARRAQQSGVFATLMKPAVPTHLLLEIYRALAGSEPQVKPEEE